MTVDGISFKNDCQLIHHFPYFILFSLVFVLLILGLMDKLTIILKTLTLILLLVFFMKI